MEPSTTIPAPRRSEDIALDLLKFIAGHANIKPGPGASTPGFGAPAAQKSEDAVSQLLELYARCRQAVEAPATAPRPTK